VEMNARHPLTGYVHAMYALHAFAGGGVVGAGAAFGGAWAALVLGAMLAGIWILYRVVRGWIALANGRAMYA